MTASVGIVRSGGCVVLLLGLALVFGLPLIELTAKELRPCWHLAVTLGLSNPERTVDLLSIPYQGSLVLGLVAIWIAVGVLEDRDGVVLYVVVHADSLNSLRAAFISSDFICDRSRVVQMPPLLGAFQSST